MYKTLEPIEMSFSAFMNPEEVVYLIGSLLLKIIIKVNGCVILNIIFSLFLFMKNHSRRISIVFFPAGHIALPRMRWWDLLNAFV